MSATVSAVTVNDNVTWVEVKSRVMAVGVALFFAYIVHPFMIIRSIMRLRPLRRSSRRNKEKNRQWKNYFKLPKFCTGLELHVLLSPFSHFFNLSTWLLWHPCSRICLCDPHNSRSSPFAVFPRYKESRKVTLGHILCAVPSMHFPLDHLRYDYWFCLERRKL